MYQRPSPMVGNDGMFYDVQSGLRPSYTPLSATHGGHPWPGLVETAGGMDDAKDWAKKNALYLGGGALIVAGLAAWKFGWFK